MVSNRSDGVHSGASPLSGTAKPRRDEEDVEWGLTGGPGDVLGVAGEVENAAAPTDTIGPMLRCVRRPHGHDRERTHPQTVT